MYHIIQGRTAQNWHLRVNVVENGRVKPSYMPKSILMLTIFYISAEYLIRFSMGKKKAAGGRSSHLKAKTIGDESEQSLSSIPLSILCRRQIIPVGSICRFSWLSAQPALDRSCQNQRTTPTASPKSGPPLFRPTNVLPFIE